MISTAKLESSATPKCVLVVDDDAVIRLVVAESLRDAGFCVVEASCSDEAKTYLRSGSHVDLVFTDINMREQFDGLLLARHVKAIYPNVRVILASGTPKPAGMHATEIFISKPYKLDGVVAIVTKTLSQQTQV